MKLPYQFYKLQKIFVFVREAIAGCPVNLKAFASRYQDLALRRILSVDLYQTNSMEREQHP